MKNNPSELALLGGSPLFGTRLFVGRPNLAPTAELLTEIGAVLDSRWLSNDGPQLKAFESELATTLGVKHCVAVCNATIGLLLLLRALALKGEGIVPSFTFIATVHAVQWSGLRPVFCDVLPDTHTLDPAQVATLISPDTSAILGVHLWGQACEIETLAALAQQHRLALIFDAAHALLSRWQGRLIGAFGQAEVFSFHATKFVNSLEGGAITTDDDQLAEKLRLMRNFGFVDYDQIEALGLNAKMNEICAAVGRSSLTYSADFLARNRENYQHYRAQLSKIPGVSLLALSTQSNFQYVVVQIDAQTFGLSRDQVVEILHAEQVIARRYFYPGAHRVSPYRELYPQRSPLPVTEQLAAEVLILPTGTGISSTEIETLCAFLNWLQTQAREVQLALNQQIQA